MRIAVIILSAALCVVSRGFAAEEAKDLLKVPPAGDRPAESGAKPDHAKPETGEAAAPAPSVSPAEAQKTPDAAPPEAAPGPATTAEEDKIVPEPYPVSRYAILWEKSPFQTESVAPPVESAGLAARFALGGILRENGEYLVWVRERGTQQSYKVNKKAANEIGLTLVEVSDNPAKQTEASATVRLGAEIGVIKFDNAGVAAGSSVPAPFVPQPPNVGMRPFPQPPRPGMPMPQNINQPGIAAAPQPAGFPVAPAPGVVPAVPGPGIPSGQNQAAPGQEPMPPPRVIRRRAIVPAAP